MLHSQRVALQNQNKLTLGPATGLLFKPDRTAPASFCNYLRVARRRQNLQVVGTAMAPPQQTRELPGSDIDTWEIVWCQDQWLELADRFEEALPDWAKLTRADPLKPLSDQVRNAHVLIPQTSLQISPEVLRAPQQLRLVLQLCSAYQNIPLDVLRERDVPLCNCAGLNAPCVAEHAFMIALSLARSYEEGQRCFQEQRWGLPIGHKELWRSTLGVIGSTGHIGQLVGNIGHGFGMRVLETNSTSSRAQLEELLAESDFIMLCCRLNEATHHLIGHEEVGMMKPGVVLVNTARAEVLDKQAVLSGLRSGRIGGFGLDVHWQEPADPSEELYNLPNVVALAHYGHVSDASYDRMVARQVANLERARAGRLGELEGRVAL